MSSHIPKKFKMGGQEIKVIVKKNINKEGAIGLYRSHHNEIHVQTHLDGEPLPKTQVHQTFCHEYIHALLDACRREELCGDEDLVDLMAEFLYQSLGSKIFQ